MVIVVARTCDNVGCMAINPPGDRLFLKFGVYSWQQLPS
jgi:hypothetical protein